jgi:lipoprotein-anchoring transpeptidase ErfK/SrfK
MEPLPSLPPSNGEQAAATGPEAPAPTRARRFGQIPGRWRVTILAAGGFVVLAGIFASGTGYVYGPYAGRSAAFVGSPPASDRARQQLAARLRARRKDLDVRLASAAPRGVYVVIDQTQNRLYLKRGDETLLQAVCSAGSGMVLKESVGKKREWIFDSPRGRFEVRSMSRNPVWAKPDWAFVEESQPIPRNPADRLEYGSLGEYAMHFGDGFMIHGTLYERLLGRAVSHGCIRVGRDDLRKVWANAHIGTQIYIY